MSTPSRTSPDLFLLDCKEDFQDFSLKLLARAHRNIAILSDDLDSVVFNTDEFVCAISEIARNNRHAQIQILVKDTRLMLENGHKLVKLTQRLSSKMSIRKLTIDPDDKKMSFILCDSDKLLYKNDNATYQGFANFKAAAEVKRLRETFDYLWQYGEIEPDLQQLHI